MKWHLELRRLDQLIPYPKNPRLIQTKDQKHLSTSLDKFGLIDKPIINTDNVIIGGHQRVSTLLLAGEEECECWVPETKLSDRDVEELNIRLNRNTGEWDWDILANEWEVEDLQEWGFDDEFKTESSTPKAKKAQIVFEFTDKDAMLVALSSLETANEAIGATMKVRA